MALTTPQFENLLSITREWVRALAVPSDIASLSEEDFTATHLFPWLRGNVDALNHSGLYVRGDGGPSVHPVYWEGISFYPDLEIATNVDRHIAFEVKFLRKGTDSGGALAKAQGQTSIYSTYGYRYSFGLIFDLREIGGSPDSFIEWRSCFSKGANSEMQIFA
jgi:hypothetical protein